MNIDELADTIARLEAMDAEVEKVHKALAEYSRELASIFDIRETKYRDVDYLYEKIKSTRVRLSELWNSRQEIYDQLHTMIRDEQCRVSLQAIGGAA